MMLAHLEKEEQGSQRSRGGGGMRRTGASPTAIPCNYSGPCSWRYFDNKCLHPKASSTQCAGAFKEKK